MVKVGIADIVLVYGITALVFLVLDFLWLGAAAKGLYDRHIGALLKDQVNWGAAVLFYAIYIGGILFFVLVPSLKDGSTVLRTAAVGGLLGLFAYATFDLTALALLRGWSAVVTAVDIVWGTVLTGLTSAIVLWLARALLKAG